VIAYCCIIMVIAYAARGASGFGASAAMPLLSVVLPVKIVIASWTLIALAAGLALIGQDRHHVAWRPLVRTVPTMLLGVLIGLAIFKFIDPILLTRVLGVTVLIYGLHALWGTFRPAPSWAPPERAAAALAGLSGGIVGTIFGTLASLFFAVYFHVIRMPKEQFRATMTAVLLTLGFMRLFGYWAIDEYNREVLIVTAILLPSMFVGIFIGNRFHHGMSDLTFNRVVAFALIASGIALLVK
jgi:uncharacterized membrane protein YfcA